MKSILFIVISLFFINSPADLKANELIISSEIAIKHLPALQIAHSGELVIFKYKNWSYTHEVVSPENLIVSVDLTGFEHQFIKSVFEKKIRGELPNWMGLLAEDFSNKILNKNGSYQKINIGNSIVYGTYSKEEQQGFIFILEERSIHKLDILGAYKDYTALTNNIIKRD